MTQTINSVDYWGKSAAALRGLIGNDEAVRKFVATYTAEDVRRITAGAAIDMSEWSDSQIAAVVKVLSDEIAYPAN